MSNQDRLDGVSAELAPHVQEQPLTAEVVGETVKEAVNSFKKIIRRFHFQSDENEKKLSEATHELQHLKRSAEIFFRFKGNRAQFEFNSSLLEKLESTESLLDLDQGKQTRAKDAISESVAEVKKRNKLIRLADKSDAG